MAKFKLNLNPTVILVALLFLGALAFAMYFTAVTVRKNGISASWGKLERPPKLSDTVRVYISSGLFNLYELIYTVGIRELFKVGAAAQIVAEHTPTFGKAALGGDKDAKVVLEIMDALHISRGGMALDCANRNWESYIPARDGFNMNFFMSAAAGITFQDIQPHFEKYGIQNVIEDTWALNGVWLLEAVYAFDMYNLISRCNCMIFNANGIAMDDGSCVELGIGTARGLPITIHRNENTSNFAVGLCNPMVSGASGTSLVYPPPTWPTPKIAEDKLQEHIRKWIHTGDQNYCRNTPPSRVTRYWDSVGQKIWDWKYDDYRIDDDGTLPNDIYSKDWIDFTQGNLGDLGLALAVAKIMDIQAEIKYKAGVPSVGSSFEWQIHDGKARKTMRMPKYKSPKRPS